MLVLGAPRERTVTRGLSPRPINNLGPLFLSVGPSWGLQDSKRTPAPPTGPQVQPQTFPHVAEHPGALAAQVEEGVGLWDFRLRSLSSPLDSTEGHCRRPRPDTDHTGQEEVGLRDPESALPPGHLEAATGAWSALPG